MRGLSKVKAWLKRRGFNQVGQLGDTDSEYYQMEGLPITIRLGSHLGRYYTISDKYINLLPGDDSDSYVIIIDKVTRVVKHRELLKVLDGLTSLYSIIPNYLKSRTDMKKEFQQRETSLITEIAGLKKSIDALKAKTKEKLSTFNKVLKKINNDIVVEMNNLQ